MAVPIHLAKLGQILESSAHMKTTTLPSKNSIDRWPCRLALLLIPLLIACFALSPQARATCQDACLTNDNTVQGDDALISNTTGMDNTALGFNALYSNIDGYANTATGSSALHSNTHGTGNTATGWEVLYSNTTGTFNTANGSQALTVNTTGVNNTATGANALTSNTFGADNTATGAQVLTRNTTGNSNTATGTAALEFSTTGNDNTADGVSALQNNTTGSFNTATGLNALFLNTTGVNNTANGAGALADSTTGSNNTATGYDALLFNTTGSNNIAVGYQAGQNLTTGNNNIDIGNTGNAGESNTIRIGKRGVQNTTVIAGIRGTTISGGIAVMIDANGRLGTTTSSARFKENIQPMDKASEAILSLKPVTFRYKHEIDPKGIPQFGLAAEEVEKVNPDLVVRDEQGKPYTVRYEAVNAMLLNEFLKEHKAFVEEKGKMQEQDANIARQQKQIDALTDGLQKLSAQVELSKPAPQTVLNNQ